MAMPIVNLTIIYVIGIILSSFISISVNWLSIFLVFVVILLIVCYFKEAGFIATILIYIGFFIIGIELYQLATVVSTKNHIINYVGKKNITIIGVVADDPLKEKKEISALFKPEKIILKSREIKNIKGRIKLAINKNTIDWHLEYGQRLGIVCKLSDITYKDNHKIKQYYYTQDIYGIARIRDDSKIKLLSKRNGNFLIKISYDIKKNLIDSIKTTLKAPSRFILQGILLGDKRSMSHETVKLFQNTGIIHILAVSGLNVGLISLLFLSFVKKILCFSEKYAYVLTLIIIAMYALITELKPSVMRASLMMASLLIAPIFYRRSNSINNLFLAALILLIGNPKVLYNLGFQFSFIATLGILVIVPIARELSNRKWLKKVATISGVSLAAWLFILPIMLYHFHEVSIIALILNVLIVPLVGIIVWLGFITYLLFNISVYLAMITGFANQVVIKIMLFLVEVAAKVPYSIICISEFNVIFVFLYYILLLGLILYIKNIIARRVDLPEVT
ncbi:MAG: ComEC/Rec2 family competence protein [bacterium]|nr:ComEC/Rec2 family competence protein [bacterium]